jgi:flagellin
LKSVSLNQAKLGAFQNRLDAVVANLNEVNQNMSASRSRIQDTDYASETTSLAKSQIIQQAATAMLAQANQSAQGVLSLLK